MALDHDQLSTDLCSHHSSKRKKAKSHLPTLPVCQNSQPSKVPMYLSVNSSPRSHTDFDITMPTP